MHGVSFDSRYWDFSVDNDQYSYVSASADAGIATFRYDRLGTGLSEKPHDAYTIVQRATDAAITAKFAEMLRDGSIGVEGQKYTKIVGVGHSYGSILMQAVTASAPTALDGVLLTGYSLNSSSTPVVLTSLAFTTASLAFPNLFPAANFSNAYLVSLAPQTFQLNFFYYPYYSTAVFDESLTVEQPVTQGVLFTFGTTPNVSSSFLGPVHVVTGAKDWNFCYGNCYAVPSGSTQKTIVDDVKELFPVASSFSTYIPPNTGHAVNLHYSAPDTYRDMLNFVEGVFTS
ncbi:hypothetical protein SERLA73DRAFT_188982 [Serpula lacrymans var. lacrymans S7.3]|uniref:AB hydrolase-1 domain-containing protein n=2 Tax=Serpula lacrymans var. lacrymans TaxID=341189 RepID=F8QCK2_SERL3|nr:uncharacterized protein SERLADRAFT_479614 [Serpula lacrymans var. lacrymans S7.9]EGN93867.1 hypothetical protein SERLA73DRAFT_188982 [Serpula lacrymans var. lacrymans S7.3]EGO19235.1 hypothetical protein SERLADRAFT_479614 [Serpula lacrymans var. lacrymans S7.9]